MKILWLNDDCTEAVIERGILWWKRFATVKRVSDIHNDMWSWRFMVSERRIGDGDQDLARWIEEKRIARREKASHERDWISINPNRIPNARLLKGRTQ